MGAALGVSLSSRLFAARSSDGGHVVRRRGSSRWIGFEVAQGWASVRLFPCFERSRQRQLGGAVDGRGRVVGAEPDQVDCGEGGECNHAGVALVASGYEPSSFAMANRAASAGMPRTR
jgi:hypothetical protein